MCIYIVLEKGYFLHILLRESFHFVNRFVKTLSQYKFATIYRIYFLVEECTVILSIPKKFLPIIIQEPVRL